MEEFMKMYYAKENGDIVSRYSNNVLKPYKRKDGYTSVSLISDKTKKKKTVNVHYFVAYCLVDGYKEDKVVNHKNGKKDDNRAENLEWITQKENIRHAKDVLGTRDYTKEKHPFYGKKHTKESKEKMSQSKKGNMTGEKHPRSYKVVAKNIKTGEELIFISQTEASKVLKISQGNIAMCLSGKRNIAGGYSWRKI